MEKLVVDLRDKGNEFHIVGAANENERRPAWEVMCGVVSLN